MVLEDAIFGGRKPKRTLSHVGAPGTYFDTYSLRFVYTAMLPARELLNPKQNTWQLNPLAAEILTASLGCASAFEQRVISQQVDAAEQLILPA